MAHVILGLLLLGDQTLYGFKKQFEAGIALFYSSSVGSLKRALDQLRALGHIEVAHQEEGPRGRKTYRITASGRAEFYRWMRSPVAGSDLETDALSRTYLLGLLEPSARLEVVDQILAGIEDGIGGLRRLAASLDSATVPAHLQDVFVHQLATLDYGIASHEFAQRWFRDYRARIADTKKENS